MTAVEAVATALARDRKAPPTPRRRARRPKRPYWTVAPAIIVLLVLTVWPVIDVIWLSLHQVDALSGETRFVGLGQYSLMLHDQSFLNSVKVTLIFVVVAATVELILGFAFAVLLDSDSKFVSGARALFLLPVFISPVAVGLTWGLLLQGGGIANYALSLLGVPAQSFVGTNPLAMASLIIADVWQWTPFMMLLSLAALRSIPTELREAASVDGASPVQMFVHVILPLVRPIIAIAFLIRILDAVKVFGLALTLTGGGPGDSTSVIGLFIFNMAFQNHEYEYASVAAVLLIVASVIIAVIYAKAVLKRRW